MKAFLEHVEIGEASSIKVKTYTRCKLDVPLHYHPEHEIVFVLRGRGKLFLAEGETSFSEGDLFLIGGGVSHLFMDDHKEEGEVVVIQFKENLFNHFKHLPEFYQTSQLLSLMSQGIKVKNIEKLSALIISLNQLKGVEKFNKLSYLLDYIVRRGSYHTIAQSCMALDNDVAAQRLTSVYAFLKTNYERNVSINEAAEFVHLSKTSLCRFLKKETGKTFSLLLNEIRIQFACKFLRETALTATEVCYKVGFNNPPYFYRQFKKIQKQSPTEYKQQYFIVN